MPQVSQEDEQSVARICRIQTKAQAVDTSEQAGAMGIWREDVRCGPQKASDNPKVSMIPNQGSDKALEACTQQPCNEGLFATIHNNQGETNWEGRDYQSLIARGEETLPQTKLPIETRQLVVGQCKICKNEGHVQLS